MVKGFIYEGQLTRVKYVPVLASPHQNKGPPDKSTRFPSMSMNPSPFYTGDGQKKSCAKFEVYIFMLCVTNNCESDQLCCLICRSKLVLYVLGIKVRSNMHAAVTFTLAVWSLMYGDDMYRDYVC